MDKVWSRAINPPLPFERPAAGGGETLRAALRRSTRPEHEALDRALSALDLSRAEDLRLFLTVQHAALASLAEAAEWRAAEGTATLRETVGALGADLAAAGHPAEVLRPAPVLHPDALAYVVLGAQMGTQILARRVPEAARGAYFSRSADIAAWRGFCDRTGALPGAGAPADRVLADAARAFHHFAAVLDDCTSRSTLRIFYA